MTWQTRLRDAGFCTVLVLNRTPLLTETFYLSVCFEERYCMPPLCIATTENTNLENKGIKEAGWSLEQHHQLCAAAWDTPHNLEGSWKASATSVSTEYRREANKGILLLGPRIAFPKEKKKEENTCAERTGVLPHSFKKAKFLTEKECRCYF